MSNAIPGAGRRMITKRQLKLRTFIGLQELSGADPGDRLLQEGIYGVVRHPRYLSVIVGTAGFAMFVNYVGAYLMVLASIPALFLVTILEERELAHRFGVEYEEYRSRVPAIFPRLPKRS
jgi:protein-S-isoprenylcysteine O-methyltransferase Ste14